MVVTLLGENTANVQKHAEVESKPESELAPIHHQVLEERTAVDWDQVLQVENAIQRTVQVRFTNNCFNNDNNNNDDNDDNDGDKDDDDDDDDDDLYENMPFSNPLQPTQDNDI